MILNPDMNLNNGYYATIIYFVLMMFTVQGLALGYRENMCRKYVVIPETYTERVQDYYMITKKSFWRGTWNEWVPYMKTIIRTRQRNVEKWECCSGYSTVRGQCIPQCYPQCLENSKCIKPNVCECNKGFIQSNNKKQPIECQPYCSGGCPEHSRCTSPDKCECDEGYESNAAGGCRPICSGGCPEHSECRRPNVCDCNKGFIQSNNKKQPIECQPYCSGGCPEHSRCTSPDKCECDEGYKSNGDGVCRPICPGGCPEHSECRMPNVCECNPGYIRDVEFDIDMETTIGMATTTVPDTTEATTNQFACRPFCDPGCGPNRHCAAPNSCDCDEGYKSDGGSDRNGTSACQPICSIGCPAFSNCSKPEVCRCHNGYQMNPSRTQCDPICAKGCPAHSVCLQPDLCQCDDGWRKQRWPMGGEQCEPICELDCSAYGRCVAPGVCECLPGYEAQSENPSAPLCRPICSKGCTNGFCFQPEICVCDPGYLMGPNDTCAAVCSQGCIHGRCVEPEICSCHTGYQLQAGSINVCEPICSPECVGADCVAPDFCICWNDHEPHPFNMHECMPFSSTSSTTDSKNASDTTDSSATTDSTMESTTWSSSTESILRETDQCLQQCACWLKIDAHDDIDKCHQVCADDHDQPCLEPRLCRCNLLRLEMTCNISEELAYDADYDSFHQDYETIYRCHVRRFVPGSGTGTTDASSIQLKEMRSRDANAMEWWWWVVVPVAVLLLAGLLYASWHRLHRRRGAGADYVVKYDDQAL